MLERIEGLPDGVLGFRARGELRGEDYDEVMIPAIEDVLTRHDKLRMLYVMGADFEGASSGGAWGDTRAGLSHPTKWERIAMVTDADWLRHAVVVFGYLMPGEVKGFTMDELDAARDWVSA